MDLLMPEDSGSATSTSTGSASNGRNTSNSGAGECAITLKNRASLFLNQRITHNPPVVTSTGSSKYFGSIDSSEHEHKEKRKDGENFKCVLQDPLWLLMANTDQKVMMTYQMPSR